MNRLLLAVVSLALFAFLIGCSTTKDSVGGSTVLINEKRMKKLIEVAPIADARTATGTVKVWTSIRNRTDQRLTLETRAIFLGENGARIEPAPGWSLLFIEPNSSSTFEGLSMSDKARSFLIEIREGNVVSGGGER